MSSATEELARRRRVRGSLEELSKLCGFTPAQHHSYIMRHLEQVTRGELDRLLIRPSRQREKPDGQRALPGSLPGQPPDSADRHRQPHRDARGALRPACTQPDR